MSLQKIFSKKNRCLCPCIFLCFLNTLNNSVSTFLHRGSFRKVYFINAGYNRDGRPSATVVQLIYAHAYSDSAYIVIGAQVSFVDNKLSLS